VQLPAVVLELVFGIVIGPSVQRRREARAARRLRRARCGNRRRRRPGAALAAALARCALVRLQLGLISPATGAAIVAAGCSVLLFPLAALTLLGEGAVPAAVEPEPLG
jgi:hypothetical protein